MLRTYNTPLRNKCENDKEPGCSEREQNDLASRFEGDSLRRYGRILLYNIAVRYCYAVYTRKEKDALGYYDPVLGHASIMNPAHQMKNSAEMIPSIRVRNCSRYRRRFRFLFAPFYPSARLFEFIIIVGLILSIGCGRQRDLPA